MRHLVLAALLIVVGGAAWPSAFARATPSVRSPNIPAETALYREAINAILAKRFADGRHIAARGKSAVGNTLVTWLWLTRSGTNAGIKDYIEFLDRHPGWPKRWTMKRDLEQLLASDPDNGMVTAWFADHAPATGRGMVRYGEALVAANSKIDKEKGIALIRRGFMVGLFTRAEETAILRRDRKELRTADVVTRLKRLIWFGHDDEAKRLLLLVPPADRALAEARLALSEMRPGVEWYLARVPARLRNDPGLIFDRARWRRRMGLDDGAAVLLESPAVGRDYPYFWWRESDIEARRQLAEGNVTRAYRLALHHGKIDGASLAESEWLAGWIMLRFLDNKVAALDHFHRFLSIVHTPISRARGAYWYARTEAALGNATAAQHWYKVAATYPTTFYGQMATLSLGHRGQLKLPVADPPSVDDTKSFARNDLVQAATILAASGHPNLIDPFIAVLCRGMKTTAEAEEIARLATQLGRPDLAVNVAKHAAEHDIYLLRYDFPLMPRLIRTRGLDNPDLILAVSRQESAFKPTARSPAGALGIMQLMPTTARETAREMHVPFRLHLLTADPAYNVRLGSHYLDRLIRKYDGDYVLALAAYDAGDHNVAKWIGAWGNPRRPGVDVLDWIELIPFAETRNYIERVMEGLEVYRALRHPGSPVLKTLAEDLQGRPLAPARAVTERRRPGIIDRDAHVASRRAP